MTGVHTVILLDWLNTDLPDRAYAAQKLMRMLSTIQPNERIAIYAMERELRVVHDFSSDPQILAEAVRKMKGNADAPPDFGALGPMTRDKEDITKLDLRVRAEVTRAALAQIQQRMAGILGRKNLIWLSSRFGENWSARTPGLAVYPVDARGLTSAIPLDLSQRNSIPKLIAQAAEQMQWKMFQQLSDEANLTGGRAYIGHNDLDVVMRAILDDGATSYTLGYTVAEAPRPGKHSIRVRAARKGVTLRYAEQFTIEKHGTPGDPVKQMGDALIGPLDITALPFNATASPAGELVHLTIQVPAATVTLMPLGEAWQVQLDLAVRFMEEPADSSQIVAQTLNMTLAGDTYRQAFAEGLRIKTDLVRPLSAKSLRLLVRDSASGTVGTVTLPIE
jgi:VWFA-related protein